MFAKRRFLYATALCVSVLYTTACEPKRVEIVKPPAALTSCADEPVSPDLPGRDQQAERDRLTLAYILGLRSAWGDCRSKVDGLRAWSDAFD
jgi:hypothetical protein